jgi:sec-independent protein translocase protein TatA
MIGDILQPTHLLFVLVVALLVLGPKRLPEVARQLGNGLRDFRAAISGEDRHADETHDEDESRHEALHQPQEHSFEPVEASPPTVADYERTAGQGHEHALAPDREVAPEGADKLRPPTETDAAAATPQPVAPTDKSA